LLVFEYAALLAADPAYTEVASMCESAKVSPMVTSHAMDFPLDHGSNSHNHTVGSSVVSIWSTERILLWKELELV